jgi:hypothetical protein
MNNINDTDAMKVFVWRVHKHKRTVVLWFSNSWIELYIEYRRIWSPELANVAIGFDTCTYVPFDELCIIISFLRSFRTSTYIANIALTFFRERWVQGKYKPKL